VGFIFGGRLGLCIYGYVFWLEYKNHRPKGTRKRDT
jgi:hypothetical protein